MSQSFSSKTFFFKLIKQEGKLKKLITLHLIARIMRSNSDLKIIILVDNKD
jgi:hypothetical protein